MKQDSVARAYARSLRWYSPEWRADHAEAMLGTLLDRADAEGLAVVPLSERTGIALSGLRERLINPRRLRWPNVVALSAATVLSLYYFSIVWSPGASYPGFVGAFSNPSWLTAALITAAFVCMVVSRPSAARILLCASVVFEVVVGVLAHAFGWFGPSWSTVLLFTGLALLAVFPWRSAIAAVIGAVCLAIAVAASVLLPVVFGLSDVLFWSSVTLLACAGVVSVAITARRVRGEGVNFEEY